METERRKTSRILNDQSFLMGLSINDMTLLGIFLLSLVLLGKALEIESMLWALILVMTIGFFLIPIRMKYRRKIIRDFMFHTIYSGVVRVSKNH